MQPVLRFAPSPNGELHLGHAFSAMTGFEMSVRLGGRFLVRIEDIDTSRTRESFITGIFEDLAWLGLKWDQPVLRQSEHFPDYAAAAARLQGMGLLYPCFATRAEILSAAKPGATDPDGAPLYPRLHTHLQPHEVMQRKARGEPFALRLDMQRAIAAARYKLAGAPLTFAELSLDSRIEIIEAHPQRGGDAVIVR